MKLREGRESRGRRKKGGEREGERRGLREGGRQGKGRIICVFVYMGGGDEET